MIGNRGNAVIEMREALDQERARRRDERYIERRDRNDCDSRRHRVIEHVLIGYVGIIVVHRSILLVMMKDVRPRRIREMPKFMRDVNRSRHGDKAVTEE